MSHLALYNKFRPIVFEDIVGQDHIIQTLKNQIKNNRVGHAYLFNGGRGTGKTSTAKILARAVNCLDIKDGEPCKKCEICESITSLKNTDIVEMDAASNNGVDDIRQMIEKVNYLPTMSKYRVYIIDEVHMLSTGAFNALLKTLEEPPSHVIFILATTEPQKLPATILSRCQRFDFRKIDNANIIKRLEVICKESNIKIETPALETIAILAEGSSRDSISILETCIGEEGETITKERVKEIVGIPSLEHVYKIVKEIVSFNTVDALNSLDGTLNGGKDLQSSIFEIIKYLKDILIFKVTNKLEIYSKEEINKIKEISDTLSKERLLSLINLFIDTENRMKYSSQQAILLQASIIKASNEVINQNTENLETRIEKLEKMLANGVTSTVNNHVRKEVTNDIMTKEEPEIKEEIRVPKEDIHVTEVEDDDTEYVSYWRDVLDKLKQNGKVILYTNLMKTKAKEEGDTLCIYFEGSISSFGKAVIEKVENKEEVIKAIYSVCKKEMKIKYIENAGSMKIQTSKSEEPEKTTKEDMQEDSVNLLENLDIPFQVIEE